MVVACPFPSAWGGCQSGSPIICRWWFGAVRMAGWPASAAVQSAHTLPWVRWSAACQLLLAVQHPVVPGHLHLFFTMEPVPDLALSAGKMMHIDA
jgi:hypothetical protein